ncbi:hypothetical protein OG552_30445 [Streptomyces sp. NBC_01476]|uniref:hypothetical protein n=1 Tax=Streptomyces sp. NBC_01476 TaxID=2903881 RepID=UPI002E3550DD|nr:hypothetical protein [Streptomyces sp. NBC_01476]
MGFTVHTLVAAVTLSAWLAHRLPGHTGGTWWPRHPARSVALPAGRLGGPAVLGAIVPAEPATDLYRSTWQRVREGGAPRFEDLKVR